MPLYAHSHLPACARWNRVLHEGLFTHKKCLAS